MVVRYDTIKVIISELVSLFYKILSNEVSTLKDNVTYNTIVDVLNNIQSNYDRIIKQNIEQLINKHFVTDDKDCYLTVDFPFIKVTYNKLDNQQLTNTDVHFLETIKIELPTIHNFKDIIQPLHSVINNNPNVDKEFLNRLTTQEYLLIEEYIFNIMSKYVDYLNHQLLMLIMFKLSKMLVNNSNKSSKVDDGNKVLGIVTIDKNIVFDEKNHSYIYKWVYGIFDVSTSERENTMKLHINYLSKKYNGSDVKIQYEYIPLPTNKVLSVSDE
jgi:hypothetical protein